jgi:hypothetical protein
VSEGGEARGEVRRLDKEGRNVEGGRRKKPEEGEERRTGDGGREEKMINGCYVDRLVPRLRMRLCCEILVQTIVPRSISGLAVNCQLVV